MSEFKPRKTDQEAIMRLGIASQHQKENVFKRSEESRRNRGWFPMMKHLQSKQTRQKLLDLLGTKPKVHQAISLYMYLVCHTKGESDTCLRYWCDHTQAQIEKGAMVNKDNIKELSDALASLGMLHKFETAVKGRPRVLYLPLYPEFEDELSEEELEEMELLRQVEEEMKKADFDPSIFEGGASV